MKAQEAVSARYKQVSGQYGGNEGICLFEDGKFMLYGYATAVFGHFNFENDLLRFYPDKPELFEVYGTQNKSLTGNTRINFARFDGAGKTFVKFGKGDTRQVFNDDANCFNGPFVYTLPEALPEFNLTAYLEAAGTGQEGYNTYEYLNDKGYNDLIFLYNKPHVVYNDFSALLQPEGEERTVLKLSNYGAGKGFYKKRPDDRQWREALEMKKSYEQSKSMSGEGVLANKHYNIFLREIKDYDYDPAKNLYVSKNTGGNEEYYQANPYNDDRFLRRYVKLQPGTKNKAGQPAKAVSGSTVFFTTCGEGSERSYRYEGLPKITDLNPGEVILPATAPPAPVPANGHYPVDSVDHKAVGEKITSAETIRLLESTLITALEREVERPHMWDLFVSSNDTLLKIHPYKDFLVAGVSFRSYYLEVNYEDARYEAVMLVNPASGSEYNSMVVYEDLTGEEKYRRYTKIENDRIRVMFKKTGAVKSSVYLVKEGMFLDYMDAAAVDRKWSAGAGLNFQLKGKTNNHLKNGYWIEKRYSIAHGKCMTEDGQYINGVRDGEWNYAAEGPVDAIRTYKNGKCVSIKYP
ncbi:hypothetical protein [Chitinophaga sp. YIM B06452]|uniref:hypothetical protein n=1 Tax=Chitinophaga sp. YIM B06452 TaxID=3082158 RepID=UPI0031FF0AE6